MASTGSQKFGGARKYFCGLILLMAAGLAGAAETPGNGRPPLTVDAFSVVRLHARAVPDARSRATLGPEREGTGIVIDSSGLILTIGYLIQEAESVEINAVDGRKSPATVIAYDYATGFGLLRDDGWQVARHPAVDTPQNLSDYVLFTDYLPKSPDGVYDAVSPVDGAQRVVGYRKVPNAPLIVISSAWAGRTTIRSSSGCRFMGGRLLDVSRSGCGGRESDLPIPSPEP